MENTTKIEKDGKVYIKDERGKFTTGTAGFGRPKGTLSLVTILKNKLAEIPNIKDKRTYAELVVDAIMLKALKEKDTRVLLDILDRVDGKAIQTVAINNDSRIEEVLNDINKVINESK